MTTPTLFHISDCLFEIVIMTVLTGIQANDTRIPPRGGPSVLFVVENCDAFDDFDE